MNFYDVPVLTRVIGKDQISGGSPSLPEIKQREKKKEHRELVDKFIDRVRSRLNCWVRLGVGLASRQHCGWLV